MKFLGKIAVYTFLANFVVCVSPWNQGTLAKQLGDRYLFSQRRKHKGKHHDVFFIRVLEDNDDGVDVVVVVDDDDDDDDDDDIDL